MVGCCVRIITVKNKIDLLQFQTEIDALFLECFDGKSLGGLWDWAYMENPNGEPLVTLCYDDDRLVGHYAIISMPMSMNDDVVNSYLSMTTMVSVSHRKYGLFVKMASENYRAAHEFGVDFIMGFPNKKSTPGFKKRLDWDIPSVDYVAKIDKQHLLELDNGGLLFANNMFSLDLRDINTRQWRMSRPGCNYIWDDGLLYKEFEDEIDVMYVYSAEDLNKLPSNKNINILMRSEESQFREFFEFEYQFGGVSINKCFDSSVISRQLCLSDVF